MIFELRFECDGSCMEKCRVYNFVTCKDAFPEGAGKCVS